MSAPSRWMICIYSTNSMHFEYIIHLWSRKKKCGATTMESRVISFVNQLSRRSFSFASHNYIKHETIAVQWTPSRRSLDREFRFCSRTHIVYRSSSLLPSFRLRFQYEAACLFFGINFVEFCWICPCFFMFYRVLPTFTEFYRVLPSFTESNWILENILKL